MVRYSHFFKSFLQSVMIHTVKGFSIVDETKVDIFLPSFLRSLWLTLAKDFSRYNNKIIFLTILNYLSRERNQIPEKYLSLFHQLC